jgi:hypothetical protein
MQQSRRLPGALLRRLRVPAPAAALSATGAVTVRTRVRSRAPRRLADLGLPITRRSLALALHHVFARPRRAACCEPSRAR